VTSLAVLFLVIAAHATAGELLTNESVTAMTKAGLGPSVIVAKIRSAKTDFDVSTDALIRLKADGVADEVIRAMIEAKDAADAAPDPGGRPITRPPAGPATPLPPIPSEPGIYFSRNLGQEEELVLVEPSVYTQSKETGVWKQALTYGIAKVRYKAVLPGAHARLLLETRRPTFYFFFDVPTGSLSNSGTAWGPATSANEFILARLDVKKQARELEVGEDGQYTGRKYGVATKAAREFDYERLAPGIYRVTPKADLADGEYCFLYGGSVATSGTGGGPKLFDFAVKLPPDATRERKVTGGRR
jgi:hypothetical protein